MLINPNTFVHFNNYVVNRESYWQSLSESEMKIVLEHRVISYLKKYINTPMNSHFLENHQQVAQDICNPNFECKLTLINDIHDRVTIDINIYKRVPKVKTIKSEHFVYQRDENKLDGIKYRVLNPYKVNYSPFYTAIKEVYKFKEELEEQYSIR